MSGKGWWALLAVLFVVAAIAERGVLSIFVIVLALASAASELWCRYCLSSVHYTRQLGAAHLAFGEETWLRLEIVNAKPLPLAWLMIRDPFPVQLGLLTASSDSSRMRRSPDLTTLLSLRWYQRVTRTHRFVGEHRGVYTLGPARLSSGDVFGMRWREQVDPTLDKLVVYPRVVPLEALGLPMDRPVGSALARRRLAEDPLRYATVRDYAPGDNPRHIHWKATARTGALQTKVFDPGAALSLVIAADVQTLEQPFETVPEFLEYGLCAAASLASHAMAARHQVGLCANGLGEEGQRWIYARPSQHPEQLAEILTALASLDAVRGLLMPDMLHLVMPRLPMGSTVVAISALPSEALYIALVSIEEAGHPVLLLTIGDEPPDVPERIESHHLGGRDAWRSLATLRLD